MSEEKTMNEKSFIDEYKSWFRIFHKSEDDDIGKQLDGSYKVLKPLIGDFDPTTFSQGTELVYERVRYVRNESVEYFSDNFQSLIMDASIDFLALVSEGDEDGY